MTVHFICRGNVLRSLIAETYLRSLDLANVETLSSGTLVDLDSTQEQEFFRNTQELLDRHGILSVAKPHPDQLTQERLKASDVIVCVNERAFEEAKALVKLPSDTKVWHVIDIGEGSRIVTDGNRHQLEEIIFGEITTAVKALVIELGL